RATGPSETPPPPHLPASALRVRRVRRRHRAGAVPAYVEAASSSPPLGRPQLQDHARRVSVSVKVDRVLLDEHLPALDRAHLTTVQADGGAHLDDVAEPRVVLAARPWLPRVIDDRHELELSDLIALERGAWL